MCCCYFCCYLLYYCCCVVLGQSTVSFAEFLELMGEILSETTRWGGLSTKLDGYVGFDTIQEQIRKKSLKRGFEFNLMVVGKFALITQGFIINASVLNSTHSISVMLSGVCTHVHVHEHVYNINYTENSLSYRVMFIQHHYTMIFIYYNV